MCASFEYSTCGSLFTGSWDRWCIEDRPAHGPKLGARAHEEKCTRRDYVRFGGRSWMAGPGRLRRSGQWARSTHLGQTRLTKAAARFARKLTSRTADARASPIFAKSTMRGKRPVRNLKNLETNCTERRSRAPGAFQSHLRFGFCEMTTFATCSPGRAHSGKVLREHPSQLSHAVGPSRQFFAGATCTP